MSLRLIYKSFVTVGFLAALLGCNTASLGTTGSLLVFPGPTPTQWGGAYDFGTVGIGLQSSAATFTIQNNGYTSISFTSVTPVTLSGANASDFAVSAQPTVATLDVGASATFAVQYQPLVVSAETASVSIATSVGTYVFTVSGTGSYSGTLAMSYSTNIPLSSGGVVTFPSLTSTQGTVQLSIQIANADMTHQLGLLGSTPVTMTNTTGVYSVVTSPVSPVPPQGYTTFTIQETWVAPGTYSETVTVKTSDASGPFTFTITGTQS